MINDYVAQVTAQQRERELVQKVEQRRLAGERAAARLGGGRLELIARMARRSRATRSPQGVLQLR